MAGISQCDAQSRCRCSEKCQHAEILKVTVKKPRNRLHQITTLIQETANKCDILWQNVSWSLQKKVQAQNNSKVPTLWNYQKPGLFWSLLQLATIGRCIFDQMSTTRIIKKKQTIQRLNIQITLEPLRLEPCTLFIVKVLN